MQGIEYVQGLTLRRPAGFGLLPGWYIGFCSNWNKAYCHRGPLVWFRCEVWVLAKLARKMVTKWSESPQVFILRANSVYLPMIVDASRALWSHSLSNGNSLVKIFIVSCIRLIAKKSTHIGSRHKVNTSGYLWTRISSEKIFQGNTFLLLFIPNWNI